jgi:hypothetical protein
MTCPSCRRDGTFDTIQPDVLVRDPTRDGEMRVGHRVCPNTECRCHVFVVLTEQGMLVESYPPETVDFDASDLPKNVLAALEETITCHAARCYNAAAMMIRKTLEEVCDHQGASGSTLHDRLHGLSTRIVMPTGMPSALHNLRLLGNDAAHVESKAYDDVGKMEVEVALDVTKEILKATYQMTSIMSRLEALKKPPTASPYPGRTLYSTHAPTPPNQV